MHLNSENSVLTSDEARSESSRQSIQSQLEKSQVKSKKSPAKKKLELLDLSVTIGLNSSATSYSSQTTNMMFYHIPGVCSPLPDIDEVTAAPCTSLVAGAAKMGRRNRRNGSK